MRLIRESWVQHTEGLPDGHSVRVEHDCGPGRVLKVSREGARYRAFCFRCDASDGFEVEEPLSVRLARLARVRAVESEVRLAPAVPAGNPRVSDWPAYAAAWVYRGGLSRADIGRVGITYNEDLDRVIIPTPCGRFWQARAVQPGRQPKYLAPGFKPPDLLASWGSFVVPTLVEDMLSAIKIGKVAEGWAILGTHISPHMISTILARGRKCNLWMDPDRGGEAAVARYIRPLRARGVEVRIIRSQRDPKLHSLDYIKETLHVPALQG
jgi:hypothetical protein